MNTETICAIATPPGMGATAMVRVSGTDAFTNASKLFRAPELLLELPANIAKFASIYDNAAEPASLVDQVVVTKFASPHSFTGEDVVEISCHGSVYIQRKIIELLIQNGCRMAGPGEFTQRAFLNGKLDLPQAEAVADLIAAQSESAHAIAVNQLSGTLSSKLKTLREQLLNISSLLELELDFSEEDVEFADRSQLLAILDDVENEVSRLLKGYKYGNMLKHGVPVAIVGEPNVGKSTLMNAILKRERAIVSDIPGTTRDTVEDYFNIKGILFRFIDTAGIRESSDTVENLGIERTFNTINEANVVVFVFDSSTDVFEILRQIDLVKKSSDMEDKTMLLVANKSDKLNGSSSTIKDAIPVSAKYGLNIDSLTERIYSCVVDGGLLADAALLTNERHYSHLNSIMLSVNSVKNGLKDNTPADIIAEDVRVMLHDLGEITGTISSEDILNNIFGKFCIGK